MSKNTRVERSKETERYNSSSAPAVWIVIAASAVLAVVALIGAAG